MKNSKFNILLTIARVFGYALLIAGFFWLFIVIPLFSRDMNRRAIQKSNARLAERPESSFTYRDMEVEAHTSINDAFTLYPHHTIPTLLMVAGGIILANAPRATWRPV
jgi:hypothetical protein